jgi:bifunctional UDP-N-acetylglucosamine pyrophosphorylase/glucosamine-1-phosphate N-acetyltransferase
MVLGVTLVDPASITIDDTVQLQPDVIIEPQTHLRGNTVIQSRSRIGPGSLIENSHLGENVTVLYSVVKIVSSKRKLRLALTPICAVLFKSGLVAVGNFVELKTPLWVIKRMSVICLIWETLH